MSLYLEQCGSGPELVLLHGWGSSSAVWMPVREQLAAHFRLTLVDLPGLGRSARLNSSGIEEIVAVLLPQMPARAIWLGWSLGGLVASRAALDAPERVSALVTLASNPCFIQRDDWPCAMEPALFDAFADACHTQPERTLSRFMALQTQGSASARAELKQLKAALAVAPPEPFGLEATLALLRQDGRAILAQVQQPSLHLLGGQDTLVPAALAQELRRLQPQAQVELYPQAAHLPLLNADPDCLACLLHFAQGVQRNEKARGGER